MIAAREDRGVATLLTQEAGQMRHHRRFSRAAHRQASDADDRSREASAHRALSNHIGAIPGGPAPRKWGQNDAGWKSPKGIGHAVLERPPDLLGDAIDHTAFGHGEVAGARPEGSRVVKEASDCRS